MTAKTWASGLVLLSGVLCSVRPEGDRKSLDFWTCLLVVLLSGLPFSVRLSNRRNTIMSLLHAARV